MQKLFIILQYIRPETAHLKKKLLVKRTANAHNPITLKTSCLQALIFPNETQVGLLLHYGFLKM